MYVEVVPKLLLSMPPKEVWEVVVDSKVLKTFDKESDAKIFAESVKYNKQALNVNLLLESINDQKSQYTLDFCAGQLSDSEMI